MLSKILTKDCIKLDLKGQSKIEVIRELVEIFVQNAYLKDRDKAVQAIMDRENIISTALGKKIAIPHAKSQESDALHMVIGIHHNGIDFDAPDHQLVNIFFMTFSPIKVSGPHIQCLAEIARLLDNEETKEKILSSQSPDDILALINQTDTT